MNRNQLKNTILIYADGACSGNPGPGGYGCLIIYPEGRVQELGGTYSQTTNNRMELTAVIEALKKIKKRSENVWILTDSTYVIRGITQWIKGWKKNGWTTTQGKDVSNQDLWEILFTEVENRKNSEIQWKYIPGHQGYAGNERCDEIAVALACGQSINLFEGPLDKYPVAVFDFPQDLPLPDLKQPSKEKKPYSYLSYVNGELQRHTTWSECEARVKGQSGAKFKKAMSPSDEETIAKEWGVSLNQLKKSSI